MSEHGFKNTHHIEFPKVQKPLIIESKPDDTGFTQLEKVAMRNAMRVIMGRWRLHAFKLFLDFFVENETLIEHFRMVETHKLYIKQLSQHAKLVLFVYDQIINTGLESLSQLNIIFGEVFNVHKYCDIPPEHIHLLTVAMNTYILNEVANICSPTISAALDKLADNIQTFYMERPFGSLSLNPFDSK